LACARFLVNGIQGAGRIIYIYCRFLADAYQIATAQVCLIDVDVDVLSLNLSRLFDCEAP